MSSDTLSGLGERILLAVWKLNGVGKRSVTEHILKSELSGASDDISHELQRLQEQGFIIRAEADGIAEFALTPIGLAILRQVEEDKLQELG
jgi:predicted transcriptional regulator